MKKHRKILTLFLLFIMSFPIVAHGQESFAETYLSSGWLSTILLIVGFIFLLSSLFVDRPVISLIISFITFALFFWGKVSIGAISPLEMVFFILGILLIIMELFIPGLSLPGIIGIVFLIFGIYNMSGSPEDAILNVFLILLISVVFIIYMFREGFKSDKFNNITLKNSIGVGKKDNTEEQIKEDTIEVGDFAETISVLRPYGFINYKGKKYDATAESNHIEKGQTVEIIEVIANKIIVKEVDK